MFDPKTVGGFLAGQQLGKSAGRIEERNKTAYELDVLKMSVAGLGQEVVDAVFAYTITLARSNGGSALIAAIGNESAALKGHLQQYGSVSESEFMRMAPYTAERSKAERPSSRALMKAAALKAVRDIDLTYFKMSETAVQRVRAAAIRDVEEFYSGPY